MKTREEERRTELGGGVECTFAAERSVNKARVHKKEKEIVMSTNEHFHSPDEQEKICQETKIGIKRKARDNQDGSH